MQKNENIKSFFLEVNGVQIPFVYEFSPLLPIISLKVLIKASGSLQNGEKLGISRLVCKMLEEGTKSLGAVGFAKKLEDKAINFSVSSGKETLVFNINSLKENFSYGVKMFKTLLDEPNFTKDTLQKLKTLTLGKILDKKSDFDYIAYNGLQSLLYENSPLEHPAIGTKESLEKINIDDIINFYNLHVDLQNAMIVIGGDLSLEEAKAYAKDILSHLPKGHKRELVFTKTSEKMQEKAIKEKTEQAYIYFGSAFYAKFSDEDLYKAKVLAFILGSSGFGSRLMEEIRVKRGLAYSIYGRVRVEQASSDFFGYLQTKNENKDKAINIVKEVINDFVANGVSEEELQSAKNFLLGSEPLRNETLSQRLSKSSSEIYNGHELGFSNKVLECIKELSLQELNEYIKSHSEMKKLSFFVVCDESK